jgi:hypothetical protein
VDVLHSSSKRICNYSMEWINSRIELWRSEEVRTGLWILFWQLIDPMIER